MTPAGQSIATMLAAALEAMRELEKTAPQDVEALRCMLVAHLRAAWPESVSPLGVLPPPTDLIRDPREVNQ